MAKPATKSPAVEGDEVRPELPPPPAAPPPAAPPRLSRDDLNARERTEHAEAMDDRSTRAAASPPASAPAKPPIPPDPSAATRYVVWPHGALQRNGVTHEPGSTLELTPEQAAAIGECVQLSAPSDAHP